LKDYFYCVSKTIFSYLNSRYMNLTSLLKSAHLPFPIVCMLFFSACHKGTDDTGNQPTQLNSLADSAAALAQHWKFVKDSSTNIGNYFFMEGGTPYYPTPGVYFGTAADYWEFRNDGSSTVHANNNTYQSAYILHTGNKLEVTGSMAHGLATVIKLTPTEAIFDWNNTSANGGVYFRRTYLEK
jgi:hypothetical protein